MAPTVPTKILILSDTHNFKFIDAEKKHVNIPLKLPVPKTDILLHCGDLSEFGGISAYKDLLSMLSSIDAELKLVIAGNHDLDLDEAYLELHRDDKEDEPEEDHYEKACALMMGPLATAAGVTYLKEGMHTFTLKTGARFTIYASPYQPEYCDFAFAYPRDEDRFNAPLHDVLLGTEMKSIFPRNPIPDFPNVDVIMTHGPPKGILDRTFRGEEVGCEALMRAVRRARPILYCFGHIHESHGAEMVSWNEGRDGRGGDAVEGRVVVDNTYPEVKRVEVEFGRETLMVNAAIMNLHGRPTNPPWLVELDLPSS